MQCVTFVADHTQRSRKNFVTFDCLTICCFISCDGCLTASRSFISKSKYKHWEYVAVSVVPNEYHSVKIYSVEEDLNYVIHRVNTLRREADGSQSPSRECYSHLGEGVARP